MAYDRQHLRIDWIFDVLTTDEVAITSMNFSQVGTWSGAEAALAELEWATGTGFNVAEDLVTMMDNANLFWGNYSRLIAVKAAAIGTNGLYLAEPKMFELTTPEVGASTTTLPQSTVVLSLRSGSSFGKANYGRMYLPHTRLGLVTGTPKSNGATTSIVAGLGTDFVEAVTAELNADTTDNIQPFIMSNSAPAPSKPVLQVAVGDVVDTQRRRRNRITEEYSFGVLTI
jgi:hypothetical protein